MSLDKEDLSLLNQPLESNFEMNKKSKITYTREYLLSLSELDICKRLPSGIDESILSEFEESSQDRQRISGAFLSHGFRRGDYSSSPPTRGDSGNYSRAMHGRWDSRSSGKSDRDSDSQSDWDSDTGRRYTSQSRRGWQAPEHDGLLGSGSFPRPSSYSPVVSAFPLNRSTEPYHPPRPYKAVPHPRRETNDSFNDETFGSSEFTSEDRAEEERKRRASFELLRKEHQKAFQERQKTGKLKDDFDITTLMEDSTDETHINHRSEQNEQKAPQSSSTDSQRSSVPIQIPGPRPLVPPGFAGTMLERKSSSAEAKALMPDYSSLPANNDMLLTGSDLDAMEKQVDNRMSLIGTQVITENSIVERGQDNLPLTSVVSNHLGKKRPELSAIGEPVELKCEMVTVDKVAGQPGHSNSILEKLFGNALSLDTGDTSVNLKPQRMMNDDTQSPHSVHSSKFVHLFPEGEKESTDDLFSGRSNNLLSLIFGEEKGGSAATSEQSWPNSLFTVSHTAKEQIASNTSSEVIDSTEALCSNSKTSAVPPVLTCEDLENSILSGFSECGLKIQEPPQDLNISDARINQPKNNIDDHASQHLLSLLQKGAGHEDSPLLPSSGANLSDKLESSYTDNAFSGLQNNSDAASSRKFHSSGKNSTLESLFGSSFMKALQSDGAPVSAQGAGSARLDPFDPHGSRLPTADEKLTPPGGLDTLSSRHIGESVVSSLSRKQHSSLSIDDQFLIDDIQIEADKPQLRSEAAPKAAGFGQPGEVRLPEDDSLIAVGDLFNLHSISSRSPAKAEFPSYSSPFDITGPQTALDALFKERQYVREQAAPSFQVPYERRDSDISFPNLHNPPSSSRLQPHQVDHIGPNVHNPPSSSRLQPHQVDHIGPIYNSQDAYSIQNNPHAKQRDSMLHHGTPPRQQLPPHMLRPIHHLNTGFDPPMLHPTIQQMHLQGSFPLSHQLQGTSGGPQLNRPNQQISGLIQELNSIPGFAFGHRQQNFGAMPPPAPEVGIGNNHPEALQRLFEMELRSSGKQMNSFPPATAGHGQGLYGNDLDLSFRYR